MKIASFITDNFDKLQSNLNISFSEKKLLMQAFTHASYVNEKGNCLFENNERLEFLGDAVLEILVSQYLFLKFPKSPEGDLTKMRAKIVCEQSLVSFADALSFSECILLGKGEIQTGGRSRPSLLADVFESFVGALFLDQGLEVTKNFFNNFIFPKVDTGNFDQMEDYKSMLQEEVQKDHVGILKYVLIAEKGAAHERVFETEVHIDEKKLGNGSGKTKKEAEQNAAKEALKNLACN